MWYAVAAVFVGGMFFLNRFLRRREREGAWDKEGHGAPEHPEPGVKLRTLETPPSPPFD